MVPAFSVERQSQFHPFTNTDLPTNPEIASSLALIAKIPCMSFP